MDFWETGRASEAFNHPTPIFLFRDAHAHCVIGQDVFDEFGPFKQAEIAAIEIILVAHVIDFVKPFDAIEIKMIDRGAIAGRIFVDEGEGGRRDDVFNAQFLTNRLDKSSLSGPHFPIESDDLACSHAGQERFGSLTNVV